MQRDGQLDSAQRGARVPTHARHRFQNVLADLVRHALELLRPQPAQIRGRIDVLEKIHLVTILQEIFCERHCNATKAVLLPHKILTITRGCNYLDSAAWTSCLIYTHH